MPSRALSDLHPLLLPQAHAFLRECDSAGLDLLVTCTYRPQHEQDALYAQGRTKPGRIVTWARTSFHSYARRGPSGEVIPASLALDFVPLRHGKLVWGTGGDGLDADPSDDDTDDLELWECAGALARKVGLVWGGDWPNGQKDRPHVQHAQAAMIRARGE